MEGRISKSRIYLLRYLFCDPVIRSVFQVENETYKKLTITVDGTVIFSRSKFYWWNRLVGGIKQYDLSTVLLNIITVLTGTGFESLGNVEAFEEMVHATVKAAIAEKDYDKAIDAVVDGIRLGLNGESHSKYTKEFIPVAETRGNDFSTKYVVREKVQNNRGKIYTHVLLSSGEVVKMCIGDYE